MKIMANGNIGIGITNPTHKLQFASVAESKICLQGDSTNMYGFGVSLNQLNYHCPATADNHIFYAGGTNGIGTELMRIKGNGNVGIGITNPSSTLEVNGEITSGNITTSGGITVLNPIAQIILRDTSDDDDFRIYFQNNLASTLYSINGVGDTFNLDTHTARGLKLRTNSADALTIDSSQNVGIGINAPGFKLDLYDSNNSNENVVRFKSSSGVSRIYVSNTSDKTIKLGTSDTNSFLWTNDAINLQFGTSNTERMRILANGNVGIGITTPSQTLHVNGTSYLNGNVGIGIDPPQCKLHVFDWYNANIKMSSNDGQYVHLYFETDANGQPRTSSIVHFWNGAVPKLRFNNHNMLAITLKSQSTSNYVGIGEDDPGTQLQITGSEPYLTLKNSTIVNSDGGCESKILFEDHDNNALGKIQCSHEGSGDDSKGNIKFFVNQGDVANTQSERIRITDASTNIWKLKAHETQTYMTLLPGSGVTGGFLNLYSGVNGPPGIMLTRYEDNETFMVKMSVDTTTPHFTITIASSITNNWNFILNNSAPAISFTGQHRSVANEYSKNQLLDMSGLIACSNKNSYTIMHPNVKKGNAAIDINNSLPDISLCKKDYDKSVYGVISAVEDPTNTRSTTNCCIEKTFDKEKGDNRTFINSLGEGAIWVSNKNGNLESGDYITSCTIPGYGMKQNSDSLKNYTVAKITMDCDFNPVTQPVPEILKDSNGENILDTNGYLQWVNHPTDTEKAYNIRNLLADGTQITESDYNTRNSNGETVYKAAFVGCTYHCG